MVTGISMRFQSKHDDQEVKRTNEFNGNININNGLDELSVQDSPIISGIRVSLTNAATMSHSGAPGFTPLNRKA